jgi:hypothetical protein
MDNVIRGTSPAKPQSEHRQLHCILVDVDAYAADGLRPRSGLELPSPFPPVAVTVTATATVLWDSRINVPFK